MTNTVDTTTDKDIYWAAKPGDEIGPELMKKAQDYYEYLLTSGRLDLWRKSYEWYYRPAIKGGKVNSAGESGEYTTITINNYRNLLRHLFTMTTSQRPAFEPRATNTDQKSQAQCILAKGLLEYYLREKKIERFLKLAVEYALCFDEGFNVLYWNATTGKEYGVNPDTGATIYEGDAEIETVMPLDMIRDALRNSAIGHEWKMPRTWKNKFTLSAKYPEFKDKIMSLANSEFKYYDWRRTRIYAYGKDNTDEIPYYEFRHLPTPALPQGRLVQLVSDDIVLSDGPLPYKDLAVYRIAGGEFFGTPFGYSVAYDLMPVQELYDILHSTVATNQSTYGVQNVYMQKGNAVEVTSLEGGMKLIEGNNETGPQPLNLTSTPPEIFNYIGSLNQIMETLSAVNSVARGNPESSLGKGASGAAMALVNAQAIQFNAELQESYVELCEDVGTGLLLMLKEFAQVPRVAAIAGKSNRSYMKEFTGQDLDEIERVTVDQGNPMLNTTAGKTNLAEMMIQAGLINEPEQLLQVMTTGKTEPVYENAQANLMNIRGENEDLAEGKTPSVVMIDNHPIHVKEHSVVLASPEARQNPTIVTATLDHIMQHIQQYSKMSPILAIMLGMPPPPQPMPMPQPGQPPAPNTGAPMQAVPAVNPVTQEAAKIKPARMPKPPRGTDQGSANIINAQRAGVPAQ